MKCSPLNLRSKISSTNKVREQRKLTLEASGREDLRRVSSLRDSQLFFLLPVLPGCRRTAPCVIVSCRAGFRSCLRLCSIHRQTLLQPICSCEAGAGVRAGGARCLTAVWISITEHWRHQESEAGGGNVGARARAQGQWKSACGPVGQMSTSFIRRNHLVVCITNTQHSVKHVIL